MGGSVPGDHGSDLRDVAPHLRLRRRRADDPVGRQRLPSAHRAPAGVRVVALSGGYHRDDANARLARNNGMIASFSRALTEGLTAQQSDDEFNAMLDTTIQGIYEASLTYAPPRQSHVMKAALRGGLHRSITAYDPCVHQLGQRR